MLFDYTVCSVNVNKIDCLIDLYLTQHYTCTWPLNLKGTDDRSSVAVIIASLLLSTRRVYHVSVTVCAGDYI